MDDRSEHRVIGGRCDPQGNPYIDRCACGWEGPHHLFASHVESSELSRPEIQAVLIHLRVEIRRPCPDHALLLNAVRKLQEQLLRA